MKMGLRQRRGRWNFEAVEACVSAWPERFSNPDMSRRNAPARKRECLFFQRSLLPGREEPMEVLYARCAGIDVHKEAHAPF